MPRWPGYSWPVANELTLKPWGRIEGTLRVGGKPLAHETVIATLEEERIDSPGIRIQNESRAQTDEQGHFVIERVVPGDAQRALAAQLRGRPHVARPILSAPFRSVAPGQTVHVDVIQEGGRPLAGKIVASDGAAGAARLIEGQGVLAVDFSRGSFSTGFVGRRSPRVAQPLATQRGGTRVPARPPRVQPWDQLKPDGTFRVDEISPVRTSCTFMPKVIMT